MQSAASQQNRFSAGIDQVKGTHGAEALKYPLVRFIAFTTLTAFAGSKAPHV